MLRADVPWLAQGYKKIAHLYNREKVEIEDSFLLCPEYDDDDDDDNDIDTLTEISLLESKILKSQTPGGRRRVKSAQPCRSSNKLNVNESSTRPKSARPASVRPTSGQSTRLTSSKLSRLSRPATAQSIRLSNARRRIKSAGTERPWATEMSKSYSLKSREEAEERYRHRMYNVHPPPHPDFRYMDRHARCFDHVHVHAPLLRSRPQASCGRCGENVCPTMCCTFRPSSAASTAGYGRDKTFTEYDQYVAAMRPRTAPSTRDHSSLPRHNNIVRGIQPHFCNFVSSASVHEKAVSTPRPQSAVDRDVIPTPSQSSTSTRKKSSSRVSGPPAARPVTPVAEPEKEEWPQTVEKPLDNIGITIITAPDVEPEVPALEVEVPEEVPPPRPLPPVVILPPEEPPVAWAEPEPPREPSPPPSPSPPPREPSPPPEPKPKEKPKKACITRKEKKEKAPKKKPEEKPKIMEEEPPIPEIEPVQDEPKEDEKSVIEVKPPDLPLVEEKEKKGRKKKEKPSSPKRQPIGGAKDMFGMDSNDRLGLEMKMRIKEFEIPEFTEPEPEMIKKKIQPWLQGRIALSKQSSRFELPMDMKLLETMDPQEYLRKYCIVTTRRHLLYQKFFMKNRDISGKLLYKDLQRAISDVLTTTLDKDRMKELFEYIGITAESQVDYKLYCGTCAFAERLMYSRFITEDTADIGDYQKEKIECADFCALDWKFHGVKVNPPMKKILRVL